MAGKKKIESSNLIMRISSLGELQPIADITPFEAIQLSMILCCLATGADVDYVRFIKENKLERHFRL